MMAQITSSEESATPTETILGQYGGTDFIERILGNERGYGWSLDGQLVELFRVRPDESVVSFFPHRRAGSGFGFKYQFKVLREIRVELDWVNHNRDVFDFDTPDGAPQLTIEVEGFGFFASLGLSVLRRFEGFFRAIDAQEVGDVLLLGSDSKEEGLQNGIFVVHHSRFRTWIHDTKKVKDRGSMVISRVNSVVTNNVLRDLFGFAEQNVSLGRLPVIGLMTQAITGEESFSQQSAEETVALARAMRSNARELANREPKVVLELRETFEIAALDNLIGTFETLLDSNQRNNESKWQTYFKEFPLALQQLFAAPQVTYGEQLTVRMPSINGSGARIVDFLLSNPLTQTGAIVELKTPGARLLDSVYRGKGDAEIYPPHKELVGAVAQLQAQLASAQSDFKLLLQKDRSVTPLETAALGGVVIVGRLADLTPVMLESFHLYRRGLRDIEVLTFDEVLERLKALRKILLSAHSDPQ